MVLTPTLGGKAAGQLIKSDDWNALVAGIDALETAVSARLDTVEATLAALDTRVTTIEGDVADLRADLDPLLTETFRVTLQATKVTFAIGETAELTAQVRDLTGSVPAPVDGERPWVDFVATWGQLKPVSGFVSRAGAADRAISVQTNAEGTARVRLVADVVEDLADETEGELQAALSTKVGPAQETVADLILAANTPDDQGVKFAYQSFTERYDRVENVALRSYADTYFVKNSFNLSGRVAPALTNLRRQRWRDYNVTVLAFGKADSDPTTPDFARGANSIQVTFRDWIGPWIIVDYFPRAGGLIAGMAERLQPNITGNYSESVDLLRDAVKEAVVDRGVLGKARDYEIVRGALDIVNRPQAGAFLPELRRSMKSAIALQQSVQQVQAGTLGAQGEEIAFEAFTNTAVKTDSKVAAVGAGVTAVQQQVRQVQESVGAQMAGLEQNVSALGGRLDATVAEGGQLQQIRATVNAVSDQVAALRSLGDPSSVNERLNLIDSLGNRLERLERGVG